MIKSRFFRIVIVLVFCVSFVGCAALQRKFVRKKKKEEKAAPVITTYDYAKELRVDELYKKHFLFWKTSQSELIDRMHTRYKKRSSLFDRTVESLMEMEKYVAGAKGEELAGFIKQIKSIDPDIKKKQLSKNEIYKMKQLLEKTKRQIDKRFSYSDVKDFLELRK